MNRERFVIAECHGFSVPKARAGNEGVTVSVLDRFYCYRVVRVFRSDTPGGNKPAADRLAYARGQARELADHLNAGGT